MESTPTTFVLFGATGDLAVKKIFPALEALFLAGDPHMPSKIVAVSRRDWNAADFAAFLQGHRDAPYDPAFVSMVGYAQVDIAEHSGYGDLAEQIEGDAVVYLSLAPQLHKSVIENLQEEFIVSRGRGRLLIEKPFGTDEESARGLNDLVLDFLDEGQVYRIDHYLGKDVVRALMDLHEQTPHCAELLTAENVASIRVALLESIGIFGRGASYEPVGAFRDTGQNHVLEMLAILAADMPEAAAHVAAGAEGDVWQVARADALSRLAAPRGTCELMRRGQYDGYLSEGGVAEYSQTETAFEVITSFSSGKLAGVPLTLQGGKRMPTAEVFIEVLFRDHADLPRSVRVNVQPQQEIVTVEHDGTVVTNVVPKTGDAYANILSDAFAGRMRDFVGAEEVQHLWRYADRVVGCFDVVPLEPYGDDRPFLIQ
jgi:glucose-6-phosphate 1-dehydrogenase